METLLADKQSLIESKEEDLALLRERLQKIETGLATPEELETITEKDDSESSNTQQEDSVSAEEIKQLKDHIHQLEQERDKAVVQLKESASLMEEEKALLIRKHEEAEETLRDNMEKLREKLESDKQALTNRIVEKEKEIKRIKRDMDELRDSIQV